VLELSNNYFSLHRSLTASQMELVKLLFSRMAKKTESLTFQALLTKWKKR